jgi:hypothetical protein
VQGPEGRNCDTEAESDCGRERSVEDTVNDSFENIQASLSMSRLETEGTG